MYSLSDKQIIKLVQGPVNINEKNNSNEEAQHVEITDNSGKDALITWIDYYEQQEENNEL
nr:14990_t:CDS:2 [Entrophospora candida]